MNIGSTLSNEQRTNIAADLYRYAYWVHLNKETAIDIVSSTMHQLSDEVLLDFEGSNKRKMVVLKCLQTECEKNSNGRIVNKVQNVVHNGSENSVNALRSRLCNIELVNRTIFVLNYLWGLRLIEIAEVLSLSQERVEVGFNETLNDLRELSHGN